MQQQINLYQNRARQKKTLLSLKNLVLGASVWLLFLMIIYYYEHSQNKQLRQQISTTKKQEAKILSTLQKTQAQYPEFSDKTPIEKQVAQLHTYVSEKTNLLSQLKEKNKEKTQEKISYFLEAFSKEIPIDSWLNKIEIDLQLNKTLLKGTCLTPDSSAAFSHHLQKNKVFYPHSIIRVFNLAKAPKKDYWNFVIVAEDPLNDPNALLKPST